MFLAKLKALYDEYQKENKDINKIIKDLITLFNISLDDKDISNYDIKNFDFQNLTIDIINKKDNTLYQASYTSYVDFLNYFTDKLQFIKLSTFKYNQKIESLYLEKDKSLIMNKITFKNGDYELIFEQEMSNCVGGLLRDGKKINIKYVKNIIVDGKEVSQILLNKRYTTNYLNQQADNSLEKNFTYYTYGTRSYIYPKNHIDEYTFKINNFIIYGINDFKQPNFCDFLRSVCIENMKEATRSHLPGTLQYEYPMLFKNNNNSAMIFEAKTTDNIFHNLEIYKSDIIKIRYNSKLRKDFKESIIDSKEYTLPILSEGIIKSNEIDTIINLLKDNISIDIFNIIANVLETFKLKLDNKLEIEKEILSPKVLINKDFADIIKEVSTNTDDYFALVSEQFKDMTNNNQERVLKRK